ncbi:MAG: hypothetical protein KBD53_09395 [Candidatus Omnitrophica bacterium]|nr:hypothetical protein [Candidatus Omnitrophota bacterium]
MNLSKIFLSVIICVSLIDAKVLFAASDVPIDIKYLYEKQTGRNWGEASPERQQEFLAQIQQEQNQRRKEKEAYNKTKRQERLSIEKKFAAEEKAKDKELREKKELLRKKKEAAKKRKEILEKKKKASADLRKKMRQKKK